MARQEFDGFIFEGVFRGVTLAQPPDRCDVAPGPAQRSDWTKLFRFGTTSGTPERLKLDAPEIQFDCVVQGSGTDNIHNWEVGILQSISGADWAAHYSAGAVLKYRVNTERGPVRDARSEHRLFARAGFSLESTAVPYVYRRAFPYCGRPSVGFDTEHGGELLSRTEGKLSFRTFLAAINKRGRILTLAGCGWTLTWDGSYEPVTKTWAPKDPDRIVAYTQNDTGAIDERRGNAALALPFSLDAAVANDLQEVWTGAEWVPYKQGQPA